MTPTDRVDWEGVKKCLTILHHESRTFLSRSLLIGGAACWFYRVQLQKAADRDFKYPPETDSTWNLWLSKDVDFTGIFRADAYSLLSGLVVSDGTGNKLLKVGGIRLGFAQVGVTFDPEEAFQRARVAEFREGDESIQFLVMDPVTLYREKQALAQKRNQPNDHAHFRLLRELLCFEVATLSETYVAEKLASVPYRQKDWPASARLIVIRHRIKDKAGCSGGKMLFDCPGHLYQGWSPICRGQKNRSPSGESTMGGPPAKTSSRNWTRATVCRNRPAGIFGEPKRL
jgi:hypothetical protein